MRQAFRGSDHLFRFGGEEFVVVLEAHRRTTPRRRWSASAGASPSTRSLRSAGYDQHRLHADRYLRPAVSCFDRADAALYYAKEQGRNQIDATKA